MSAITFDQAATFTLAAGFPASAAPTMVAIMAAESSLDPLATCDDISIYAGGAGYARAQQYSCTPANAHPGPSCGPGPWTSFGLGQVNLPAHYPLLERLSGSTSPCAMAQWLYTPANNAAACLDIYLSAGFGAWTTYNNGAYRSNLSKAQAAVASALQQQPPPPPPYQPPSTLPAQRVQVSRYLPFLPIVGLGILGMAAVGEGEFGR